MLTLPLGIMLLTISDMLTIKPPKFLDIVDLHDDSDPSKLFNLKDPFRMALFTFRFHGPLS